MHSFEANAKNFVAIGSPNFALGDSSTMGAGKVEIRDLDDVESVSSMLYGTQEFENFGNSITTAELDIEVASYTYNL